MRRLLVALGLIGLFSPAFAADYGLPRYDPPVLRGSQTYVPAYPTYPNWQGFYAGGQVSYISSSTNFSGATQPLVAFSLRNSTVLAQMNPDQWQVLGINEPGAPGFGGFIGYNVQWDNAVIGLEFNYSHTSLNAVAPDFPLGRSQFVSGGNNNVFLDASGSFHIHDVATTRARFGWTIDSFMPYLTMGLAIGRADVALSTTATDVVTNNNNVVVAQFLFSQSQAKNDAFIYGLSAGAGLEFALTQCIFGRADYEYIHWTPFWQIASGMHNLRLGLGVRF